MKKLKVIIIIFFLFLSFIISSNQVFAKIVECKSSPCSWQDLSVSFGNLIKQIVQISYWLAFLICTIGAFLIMFAGPNQNFYQRGKEMIKIALIGYALILTSGIIFEFVIIEIFSPKLRTSSSQMQSFYSNFILLVNVVFSQSYEGIESGILKAQTLSPDFPKLYLNLIKQKIASPLQCGRSANTTGEKLLKCISEISNSLANLALFALTFSIIVSAGALILAPVLGSEKINNAKTILLWSIIGLIIILTAKLIVSQVDRIFKVNVS